MFEVGEHYKFKMWEPGENGGDITEYATCTVLEVSLPLVKVTTSGEEVIINTASQSFVSATKAQ
jgi:hypothetical protein